MGLSQWLRLLYLLDTRKRVNEMKHRIRVYSKAYFVWLGYKAIVELEPFGRCMVLKSESDELGYSNIAF